MTIKAADIRNMTPDEINIKVNSIKGELFKLEFDRRAGRVEKPHRIREAKRNLARLFTILREKEDAGK